MTKTPLYCSFCGKRQDEVAKLIAGPTVFICNECVDLCQQIVSGTPLAEPAKQVSLVEQQQDADAIKALAEMSLPPYLADESLPAELRELAAIGPVLFSGHVLLSRRDWDRLVALYLYQSRTFTDGFVKRRSFP